MVVRARPGFRQLHDGVVAIEGGSVVNARGGFSLVRRDLKREAIGPTYLRRGRAGG